MFVWLWKSANFTKRNAGANEIINTVKVVAKPGS